MSNGESNIPQLGGPGLDRPSATTREDAPRQAAPSPTIRENASLTATQREADVSTGRPDRPSRTEREQDGEPGAYATPLPRSLSLRFIDYHELPAVGGEADCFVVKDEQGNQQFLKVYRLGVEPKTEILEKLLEADPRHVVRLVDFACCRERRWWELQEYVTFGTLEGYISALGRKLSLVNVQAVLEEILPAIEHLHSIGIEHKDLKPDNILVRSSAPKLDLVVTDFGIASMLDESVRFTKAHRTIRYAPPEAQHGVVVRNKWDYWSLGIMLVEMVAGRHPFADLNERQIGYQLSTIAIDDLVPADMDRYWRNLCRGLLRRDPNNRWGAEKCRRWLTARDDPSLTVVDEAPSTASDQLGASAKPSPSFAGKTYNSPEALAAAMAANWEDATAFWQTRQSALFDWLRQDLGLGSLATQLAALDKDKNRRLPAQIFSLVHVLDVARPLSFRGRAVTSRTLNEAAQGAARGRTADSNFLRELQAENILTIGLALRPQQKDLGVIAAAWNNAIAAFRRLSEEVRSNAGGVEPPSLEPDLLSRLLAAAVSGEVLNELQAEAQNAPTTGGARLGWFRLLDDGSVSGAPAAALLQVALAGEANRQATELRAGRATRNEALWGHMAGGAILAVIAGCVWLAGANAFCSNGTQFCTQLAWQNRTINAIDMIYGAAAIVAAVAVLFTVHSRTTSGD